LRDLHVGRRLKCILEKLSELTRFHENGDELSGFINAIGNIGHLDVVQKSVVREIKVL
jgi:hypothetical protein